jgi:deazaflavin-dependent oxidoreductase (nitroreductase family)
MTEIDKNQLASSAEALHAFNRGMVAQFRAHEGKVGGLPGGELLLLHTTGAKSGKPRLSPLAYLPIDGAMVIVGSYLGASKDPAWVHNLRSNPRARVEVGTDAYDVIAHEMPRERRAEVYARVSELAPVLAEYQDKTDRVIPLFELTRA